MPANPREFSRLDFHSLGEGKRILDVNAEVANSAFDLSMAE